VLSVDEAQDIVLKNITTLEAEERPILDCLGQVLAADIRSTITIPPADNSGMDGFAVRAADIAGAGPQSPRILRVIGVIPAGSSFRPEVKPGTAARIMTGGVLPPGADAVVRFEDTDARQRPEDAAEVGILAAVAPGNEVRRAGGDIQAGSLVLAKGTLIRPAEVGVLASVGKPRVPVYRQPSVAVIATGDEIIDVNRPLPAGRIYNSNGYSVAALVRRYGGIPRRLGIARDNESTLAAKLRKARGVDMVITSGGVSQGDYDIVRRVLAQEGELIFWQVRARPGKPVVFGMLKGENKDGSPRRVPFLGLSGNPVSAMVNFQLFARPAIMNMMGRRNLHQPAVQAITDDEIENTDGRRFFARAVITKRDGRYSARLTGPQGSSLLTSMALANGLVVVPEETRLVKRGETVSVMMLDWNEGEPLPGERSQALSSTHPV